ncbi:MAG: hypothetical protein ACYTGL_07470 [Planctomycetota bacterium]|jgi:hypothetical protein
MDRRLRNVILIAFSLAAAFESATTAYGETRLVLRAEDDSTPLCALYVPDGWMTRRMEPRSAGTSRFAILPPMLTGPLAIVAVSPTDSITLPEPEGERAFLDGVTGGKWFHDADRELIWSHSVKDERAGIHVYAQHSQVYQFDFSCPKKPHGDFVRTVNRIMELADFDPPADVIEVIGEVAESEYRPPFVINLDSERQEATNRKLRLFAMAGGAFLILLTVERILSWMHDRRRIREGDERKALRENRTLKLTSGAAAFTDELLADVKARATADKTPETPPEPDQVNPESMQPGDNKDDPAASGYGFAPQLPESPAGSAAVQTTEPDEPQS